MAKTERLFIRITPELKTKLQEQAEKEHRTLSNYVESILRRKIPRYELLRFINDNLGTDVTDPFNPKPIETDVDYKY